MKGVWRAFGALLCGCAVTAQAGTAVVATEPCSESGTARWASLVREAVSKRPGLTVLDGEETAGRLGGVPRGSFADAARLIRGSRADLFADNWQRPELTLKKAIEDLVRLPPSPANWRELSEAWTMLAQLQQRTDRPVEAEESLQRVLRVDRAFVPDESYYSPSFRKFVDGVRRKVDAESTASLRVTTRPTGMTVFIDGRPVGRSPVTLPLPPGDYRVEAAFPEARGAARFVKVQKSTEVELDAEFEGAIHPSFGPCIATKGGREARLVALVRLAGTLGVKQLIAVREEEPAPGERYLVASAVDGTTGEEVREARVKMYGSGFAPGAVERLAEFLATGTAEPPVQPIIDGKPVVEEPKISVAEPAPQPVPLSPPPGPAPSAQVSRSRLPAWAATVGAAALVGVAGWQGSNAWRTGRQLDGMRVDGAFPAGTEDEVRRLNGRLATQRNWGIGLGAGGVAAAVGAGMLFSWSGEFEEVRK